jgi:hypothetical protein
LPSGSLLHSLRTRLLLRILTLRLLLGLTLLLLLLLQLHLHTMLCGPALLDLGDQFLRELDDLLSRGDILRAVRG